MNRVGWNIGRDQTYRLMKIAGVAGAHRGRKPVTTRAATVVDDRPDLVNRDFTATAPNRLWVADFTYIRTYSGFCYTAFITDVFSPEDCGLGCVFDDAYSGDAFDGFEAGFVPGEERWF
ncbi:hypothetical protein [Rothia amarae]|uniref:hypothetical protein n=1 Tax=Rothia amarae TaxID=169480 RepID=UPI003B75D32D